MKKAIIASLAIIGGITLVTTTIVGAAVAVEAAKDKKRLAKMTPEEQEIEKLRRSDLIRALLIAYGKKADEDVVEDLTDDEIISVEEF